MCYCLMYINSGIQNLSVPLEFQHLYILWHLNFGSNYNDVFRFGLYVSKTLVVVTLCLGDYEYEMVHKERFEPLLTTRKL